MIVIPVVLVTLQGEVAPARLTGVLAEECYKLLWLPYRKHAQHQGVDQAEDRGVGADPQR